MHVAVWVIGYRTNKVAGAITFLNLAAAFSLVVYWLFNQLNITQHIIEGREIIVLVVEVLLMVCAVYSIVTGSRYNWLKIMQYIFFVIHLLVLLLGLIFMVTFKINKLI